jgi:hypothetical protein
LLSIVLYGRNDNYGYNLHKRAALSLNCMAEVLSHADDEILFVDYNTPDDFPTFPEAIADTLTAKAKNHLRVLRVRPEVHARFATHTHLLALEPVARNVAVRRSNPANRWILSTNTDMIFVPRKGQSLSEIARNLPSAHYGIPRFEVPETLWEALDRCDPRGVIDAISRWGWDLHLNEIVTGMKPFLFDGPGDFQLMQRDDLFEINGFNEKMLLGWHVDANIAKRLSFIRGDVGDLSDHVFGYHCDHTRQVTPAHKSNAVQNSMHSFFYDVVQPGVPEQAESWGCPNDEIEEIRLSSLKNSLYFQSLETASKEPLLAPRWVAYIPENYNRCDYSPEHVLPFLLDIFSSAPRNWQVAWLGAPGRMLSLFIEAWRRLGFTTPILLHQSFAEELADSECAHISPCSLGDIAAQSHAFIFDFSRGDGTVLEIPFAQDRSLIRFMLDAFKALIVAEKNWVREGCAPRRFLGINAIHNQFEKLFDTHINCAKTPFSVRIRHGFLFESGTAVAAGTTEKSAVNWDIPSAAPPTAAAMTSEGSDLIERLQPGPAGLKHGHVILTRAGEAGLVAQTMPILLPQGSYRLEVECRPSTSEALWALSNFDLWFVDMTARIRRLLGYSLERQMRRAGSRLIGRRLSERIKVYLKKRLTHNNPQGTQETMAPILQMDIYQGRDFLGRRRALGGDVTALKHILEFDVQNEPEAKRGTGVVMSLVSNGGASFAIFRARLSHQKRLGQSTPDDKRKGRDEATAA